MLYYQDDWLSLYHGRFEEVVPEVGILFDAVICDPPFGVTANDWDKPIPLGSMWDILHKTCKMEAPMIFFCQNSRANHYAHDIHASNRNNWRRDLVWDTARVSNPLNARKMEMRRHQDIKIFSRMPFHWNRVPFGDGKTSGRAQAAKKSNRQNRGGNYGAYEPRGGDGSSPGTILYYSRPLAPCCHPQEKPLALMEYLVKAYTRPGDRILDFTCGRGALPLAAKLNGRYAVGVDREIRWIRRAAARIARYPTLEPNRLSNIRFTANRYAQARAASADDSRDEHEHAQGDLFAPTTYQGEGLKGMPSVNKILN